MLSMPRQNLHSADPRPCIMFDRPSLYDGRYEDRFPALYGRYVAHHAVHFGRQAKKRGRPQLGPVTAAATMMVAGKSWPVIYRACIPGYRSMSEAERAAASRKLRGAVTKRVKRAKPRG